MTDDEPVQHTHAEDFDVEERQAEINAELEAKEKERQEEEQRVSAEIRSSNDAAKRAVEALRAGKPMTDRAV